MPLDVLYQGDVDRIEELCKKHGMENMIDYKYTKSRTFVRVSDISYKTLEKVLKIEYGL